MAEYKVFKGKKYYFYGRYNTWRRAYNNARWLKRRIKGLNYWIDVKKGWMTVSYTLYTDKAMELW